MYRAREHIVFDEATDLAAVELNVKFAMASSAPILPAHRPLAGRSHSLTVLSSLAVQSKKKTR